MRRWPRKRLPGNDGQLELTRPGRSYYALGNCSGAVGDIDPFTGGKPANRARMLALPAAQDDLLAGQVGRGRDEDRRPQDRPALRSAAVERISQPAEEALLAGRELTGRSLLAAKLGQLPEQFFLLRLELGRRLDADVDHQIAPT